jgi:EpsI family protein
MGRDAGFLKSRAAIVVTACLVLQAAFLYGFSRSEQPVEHVALASAPHQFGRWRLANEGVVEKEVQDVLKADDLLTRSYVSEQAGIGAHLFVAFFKTQRAGQAPHSPKNCLPGSGWVPSDAGIVQVEVPGREPIDVNRYIVAKADNKSLVMYWYQSRDRVVASEYTAKFFVVADAMRYNRTDTALVRVTVPVVDGNVERSQRAAEDFIRAFFTPLRKHFPA